MSILDTPAEPFAATADAPAIAGLHAAFERQRAAFAADRAPDASTRRERLGALMGMLVTNRARIADAIAADFGAHPAGQSDLIEVLGPIGRAQFVSEQLDELMAPSVRHIDATVFGSAAARVEYQPKGVIGNMVPWNFPFDLSVGPMVDMLAAGNRVIVKPSEYTPACAALLAEMVAAAFDPDLVHVAVGGVELARAFSALPWDHLLYTGSPGIGREVMAAAARNLTPVTLELGGKCPALLTPGAVTARNVESVIGTKIVKNGQMCVSVDYALVPRGDVEAFITESQAFMARVAPDYSRGPDCTGIISDRHLQRLTGMLDEAAERQTRIVPLEQGGAIDPATRRMPMSLVIDPAPDLKVMTEEIFGPILPVVPFDTVDEAIALVNAGERPLGLFVFGDDATADRVLAETHSGGACVNTCAVQSSLPSMGFGGSGMSGMGRHHGPEGFREFSNPRGVVRRGEGDMIDAFYAPYAKAAGLVDAVLAGGMSTAKFDIAIDAGRCLVRITMAGYWDLATVAEYKGAMMRAAGTLLAAGCKGRVLALVDTRLGGPLSQDVVAHYQAELGSGEFTPRRLATIVSSALLKRQVERIAIPNQRLFADEAEALAWLLSPDEPA